ncbi:hypothetical protein ACFXC8_21270, partial [Streptomyces sp. NPDC059441]|uniref:hypothetical protein n=1 Tax=Streptomyces sp. NPDC059441 TaxID=3346829 RepID=UPI00368A8CB6
AHGRWAGAPRRSGWRGRAGRWGWAAPAPAPAAPPTHPIVAAQPKLRRTGLVVVPSADLDQSVDALK